MTQMQAAGDLMYFGGDIAELLLALTLLLTAREAPSSRLPRSVQLATLQCQTSPCEPSATS